MSNEPSSPDAEKTTSGWLFTVAACAALILVGSGLLYLIFTTEPTADRAEGTKTTAMLVNVISVDTGTYRPQIEVMGTVEPAQDVILRPRVSGQIIRRSDEFTPGGFVSEGDTLVRIEPDDYQHTLQQRQSELRQAKSDLRMEMGRQDVAREEYEFLDESLSKENRALVLREPQLEAARAQVASAQAAVDQARLNLERTTVEAPFDAQVIERNVNVGSQVSAGDNLARLVGMDTYWVETTVPLTNLQWLNIPDTPGANGSRVRIRNRSAWPDDVYRIGHLDRLVGELEDEARMARVLVEVNDPLGHKATSFDSPPLIIGSFVQTLIQGEKLSGVVRLQREYVRDDETVWVMQDGQLDIRDVQIAFQDSNYAYIREGLRPGERIVTTNLSTVVDGAPLRLDGADTGTTASRSTNESRESS